MSEDVDAGAMAVANFRSGAEALGSLESGCGVLVTIRACTVALRVETRPSPLGLHAQLETRRSGYHRAPKT